MTRRQQTIGFVLIAAGILLLLARGLDISVGALAWPLFIIVPGVVMLVAAFTASDSVSGLAVPGSIVTTVGTILFLQNLTQRFETWSYSWALVLASVGVGIFLQAALDDDEAGQRSAIRIVVLGLTLFALFGVFFEFVIFGGASGSPWVRFLIPILLIVAGAYLLTRSGPQRDTES